MSSIKVAVRVRPLNEAEISRNCVVVLKTDNSQITASNPESKRTKTFKFDDVFPCDTEDEYPQLQNQVCSVLGDYVLSAAFEGYNTCVFSYGQSGTGKTYTMFGDDNVQGLIEYVNEDLFNRAASSDADTSFRAEISFLEIYNECVNDLLTRCNQVNVLTRNNSLKVHDDPERGTYVEKLSKQIVTNIDETKKLIEKGNKNRIALQSSDGLSRRSHTIFILQFTQAKMVEGIPSEKVSTLSFVDLAGTDRRHAKDDRTITPDEDNEASIARSLRTFGQVISSLASKSNSRKQEGENGEQEFIEVPYKESALTLLLKDCLGGNCKTVMLATVSPADIHFNKTISTLRYANHTKNITNQPSVNEEANVKLIKDLQDEIEELKLRMGQDGISLKSEQKMKENERLIKRLTGIWEEKWIKTKEIMKDRSLQVTALGQGLKFETDEPHFITLGGGRLSVGVTMCPVKEGKTIIGLPTSDSKPDIALSGTGIEREHCVVEYDGETVMFFPNAPLCSIDGVPITEPTKLPQGCMVCLGKSNYFRFNHPKEAKRIRERNPGNRFSVMPDKYCPEVELAIEQRKCEQQERDRLKEENARLWAREKQHKEALGRLEYEKKQLKEESSRLRNLERLQRAEADKFKTRITAQIQEMEEQRDELMQTDKAEEKLSILEGKYGSQIDGAGLANGERRYFVDEEEKLNKIQVLQAERVKLMEKDLEEQIFKLHETRDLELAKINAERERINELAKQQQSALEQVEIERMRLQDEQKKEVRALDEEREKLKKLEVEKMEIIEKAFQEREQGKQEIEAEKQRLADLQKIYNEQLIGLQESMLSSQEKMEKERQLEFEFFETEQLMLEELELKQREASEQMDRERKLIEAHFECERQEEKRKLEMEKLKVEDMKREHTSAIRHVEEERKKLQLERQRQQEQMVRDKVRLTNIEAKYKELLSRAEEEQRVIRVQLEKEKEDEIGKFRQEMLQTMSSVSSLDRQSPTGSAGSKRTNSSDDVGSTEKKSTDGQDIDELESEREKLRQQFEHIRDQEERLIIKEREMASLDEKSLDYQQKIDDLEKKLEEERMKRESSENDSPEGEQVTVGNGGPRMSVDVKTLEQDFDLVQYLLSTGHVLDNCPSVNVTQSCCRGYLDKKGGKLKSSWKKRWFVFDRRKKALVYYKEQGKKEPRAIIYFQAVQEVYVDHESEAKNNSVRSSFCVKTPLKTYTLAADSALTMSVWIDVLLTGKEGTTIINN